MSQNNKLRRRKLNLYLLMEADCIIHSAGASECVGNRMYDGWPSLRSSPLRRAVHLFICLFIYSLIQRDAPKLWICFEGAAAAEECLAASGKAPSSSLSSDWLGFHRCLGQGFAPPTLRVPSWSVCVHHRHGSLDFAETTVGHTALPSFHLTNGL